MERIRHNQVCVDLISDTCRQPLCREIRFLPAHRVVGDESADEDQRLFELILGVVDISCCWFLGFILTVIGSRSPSELEKSRVNWSGEHRFDFSFFEECGQCLSGKIASVPCVYNLSVGSVRQQIERGRDFSYRYSHRIGGLMAKGLFGLIGENWLPYWL